MFRDTWDQETEEGKKRVERLIEIIRGSKYREDVRKKVLEDDFFRGVRWMNIVAKMSGDADLNPPTELGKAWKNLSAQPHILELKFPDPARRAEFAEDARTIKKLVALEKKYPEICGLTAAERHRIISKLGVKRPAVGGEALFGSAETQKSISELLEEPRVARNWWLHDWKDLVEDERKKKEEAFLARYRSNPREDGNKNEDLVQEWNAINIEGLHHCARFFGETRNRNKIVHDDRIIAQSSIIMPDWAKKLQQENPERHQKFLTEFLNRIRSDHRINGNKDEDLLREWPEAETAAGLMAAARFLGEKRTRVQIHATIQTETKTGSLRQKIRELEKTIRTVDEVAAKLKKIPTTDLDTPYVVHSKHGEEGVKFIGSTFIGMMRPSSTYEQPLSNTLREAEARRIREGKPDVVILTGDIVYLDTIRYSNLTAKRSLLEDIPFVPEVVEDPWVLEQFEKGEIVLLTFKEKLEMALRVVRGTFAPGGKPLYSGKLLGCLGKREEDIANYMANERANALVAIVRANFMLDLVDKRLELKEAQHDGDDGRVAEIKEEIEAIQIRMHERLKMTSIWRRQTKELFERALCYIAVRLEETIPGLKIISAGEAFIRVGNQLNHILQKGTESPKDTFEGRMIKDFSMRATAGEKVPDLTVGGGLNPVWTRGEIDQARGEFTNPDMRAPFIITLPTCTPSEYLRSVAKEIYGATTAGGQAKLIRSRDFAGGVFDMNWVSGIPMVRLWTDECLTNRELWSSKRAVCGLMEGNYMIYELVSGCEHRGQNWQAYFEDTPEGPQIFTETLWKFILTHNIPLHMVHFLGDKWTGHNFPGKSYQKPEKWMPPDQERHLLAALDLWPDQKEKVLEILRTKGDALKFILREFEEGKANPVTFKQKYTYFNYKMRENAILAGIDALDLQIDSWRHEVLPYEAEIVAQALKRAHKAGVCTLGHSIGLCVCHTGNHVPNTEYKAIGLHLKEGHEVEVRLQDAIRMTHPELWRGGKLTEEIVHPKVGISSKAEGLFGRVPPKLLETLSWDERERYLAYRMAAKHRGAQGGSKYTDLIRVIQEEDAKRGRRRAHGDKFSVSHFGHSHYCFSTLTRRRYLSSGGCHCFDDPYGEAGNYRLTSVCVTVHGFPSRGPAWGPITEVHLRYAELKDYFKNPWPINTKRLFPNAL